MRCDECRFWKTNRSCKGKRGECRVKHPSPATESIGRSGYEAIWPTTLKDDWCGEFQAKTQESDCALSERDLLVSESARMRVWLKSHKFSGTHARRALRLLMAKVPDKIVIEAFPGEGNRSKDRVRAIIDAYHKDKP